LVLLSLKEKPMNPVILTLIGAAFTIAATIAVLVL